MKTVLTEESWVKRIDTIQSPISPSSMPPKGHPHGMAGPPTSMAHHNASQSSYHQKNNSKEDTISSKINLLVDDGGHRIPAIVKLLDNIDIKLESVELHKPTLDDVFLAFTGRRIREERGNMMDTVRRHRTMHRARK